MLVLVCSLASYAGAQRDGARRARATVTREGKIVVTGLEEKRLDDDVIMSSPLLVDLPSMKRLSPVAYDNPEGGEIPLFGGVEGAPVWYYESSRGLTAVRETKGGPRRGWLGPEGYLPADQPLTKRLPVTCDRVYGALVVVYLSSQQRRLQDQ